MRIRTITTGARLGSPDDHDSLIESAKFNMRASKVFSEARYEVQTTRVSTQPWPEYVDPANAPRVLSELNSVCAENSVSFLGIGPARSVEQISAVPAIIMATDRISASAGVADSRNGINKEAVRRSAESMIEISKGTPKGVGNFRFCASANIRPGTPFFPAGFHDEALAFSIGLECGDIVQAGLISNEDMDQAIENLRFMLNESLANIEDIAVDIASETGFEYLGIDASTAPGLDMQESVVAGFENHFDPFGSPGTLGLASMVTRVLRSLDIKTCGYTGLMLPVMEDQQLARRWDEGQVGINDLLLLSSVCGTGLDAVPLPGDASVGKIEGIILDMSSLSVALDKPLSARLLPVPGRTVGDRTDFQFQYLIDCMLHDI